MIVTTKVIPKIENENIRDGDFGADEHGSLCWRGGGVWKYCHPTEAALRIEVAELKNEINNLKSKYENS